MFKNLSKTTKLFGGLIMGVIVIMVLMIARAGNEPPQKQQVNYVNDNASADNKVEALKTMTADLLAVENKNKQLQTNIKNLQAQNKKSMAELMQSVSAQVQQALKKTQAQNQQKQQMLVGQLKQKAKLQTKIYPRHVN